MNIQLNTWRVKSLSLTLNDEPERLVNGNSFDLSTGNSFPENDKRQFAVGFEIALKDEMFRLNLKMMFFFTIDEDITEDFKKSDFVKINAPAIAFPYVRSYISNLTLQSGIPPIILPSVNFVKLVRDNENKEKEEK